MNSNVPRMCFKSTERKSSPCMDCGDRTVGCHGTCEKYKAYNEQNKADYQKRITAYAGEYLAESYEVKSKLRTIKRRRR